MNFNKLFNKKREIYLFYLLILIIIIFLIIYQNFIIYDDIKKEKKIRKDFENVALQEKQEDKDTDNDGLNDWEEFLYQTDLENPDTDGDGINDGDEVKNGKNPLIFGDGPAEEIEKIKIVQEKIVFLENQKKKFEQINEKQKNIQDLLKGFKNRERITETESKLVSLHKERNNSIKIDFNKVGSIIKKNLYRIDNETEIFHNLFLFFSFGTNEDYRKLTKIEIKELNNLAESYKKTWKELEVIEIKNNDVDDLITFLTGAYKNIATDLFDFLEVYEKRKKKKDDWKMVSKYLEDVNFYGTSLKYINSFIVINNIKFNQEENGGIFAFSL